MSMSIMNLYSAESWSISTALCVLSGNAEISSSSTVAGNDHCWAPGHGDYPVVNSRPSDLRQRRPDDQKYWAGDILVYSSILTAACCNSTSLKGYKPLVRRITGPKGIEYSSVCVGPWAEVTHRHLPIGPQQKGLVSYWIFFKPFVCSFSEDPGETI